MSTISARDLLFQLQVKPTKERGQNFLIDPAVIDEIITFGRPGKNDHIVEIGPGLGALTRELQDCKKLTLIELEEAFCERLERYVPTADIICSDVMEVDFSELGNDLLVFGNLPYSCSSDILFHLIKYSAVIRRAVVMLQKEFVERICSAPGKKSYNALSIATQIHVDARPGAVISGKAFHPQPAVQSQLVELVFYREPKYQIDDFLWFRQVLAAAFCRRRKKIHNSLKASAAYGPGIIERALQEANIDPARRPEALSIDEFVELSSVLYRLCH